MPFHVGYFGCQTEQTSPDKDRFAEVLFLASDWRNKNFLKIIQTGSPGINEVGPHGLPIGVYTISIYRNQTLIDVKHVLTDILIDRTTGIITLWKASKTPAFSGRAEIIYAGVVSP